MVNIRTGLALATLMTAVAASCATPTAPPPTPTPSPSASLSELNNIVNSRPQASADWLAATDGQALYSGGGVQTGESSGVRVSLIDGSIVRLAANSGFEVLEVAGSAEGVSRLTLLTGKIFVALTEAFNGQSLEIETPVGVATVRGSIMSVQFNPETQEAVVGCLEGHCAVSNEQGTQELVALQESTLATGQPPAPPRPIDPLTLQDFFDIPEAQSHIAASDSVILPGLACMADRSCDVYCAGQPGSAPPADCVAFEQALVAQGVNFGAFRGCVVGGGEPQSCADNNRNR